jgi:hypothetical protein
MRGFEWKDQRGIEGTGFVRAIRHLLTAELPRLMPNLSRTVSEALDAEITKVSSHSAWRSMSLFAAVKRIVTNVNCAAFFPPELGNVPNVPRHVRLD